MSGGAGSSYIAQASLKIQLFYLILCQAYRHVPPHMARNVLLLEYIVKTPEVLRRVRKAYSDKKIYDLSMKDK